MGVSSVGRERAAERLERSLWRVRTEEGWLARKVVVAYKADCSIIWDWGRIVVKWVKGADEREKMKSTVDIRENEILKLDKELLQILLKDKTTGRNIIWATDNYLKYGEK